LGLKKAAVTVSQNTGWLLDLSRLLQVWQVFQTAPGDSGQGCWFGMMSVSACVKEVILVHNMKGMMGFTKMGGCNTHSSLEQQESGLQSPAIYCTN